MLRRRPLMRAAATTAVVAGTATAVSGRVARRQQAKAQPPTPTPATDPQAAVAAAPQGPSELDPMPPPPGGLTPGAMAQLEELGALKEKGILTEKEFTTQKAKILGP